MLALWSSHLRLTPTSLWGYTSANLVFLPIEKVVSKDKFVLEARETYWLRKYDCMKTNTVHEIEHGVNLNLF